MEDHGTVFETRVKLMRERIEAMKEIWTKSKAECHGDVVDFPEMMTWPKPVQKPYPPILVGGGFPQARTPRHPVWRRLVPGRPHWLEPARRGGQTPTEGARCRARSGNPAGDPVQSGRG
jgi:hypothetical protein